MKISLHWLQDFVHFQSSDVHHIAERLTVSSAEVERIEECGELLHRCCIGKIIAVKKHPKADRLFLCDVETDRGKKKVVCGGSNLRDGMLVAFAHTGARVHWHGKDLMTLEKATIRGEESEGMICAASELGLEDMFPTKDEHKIIDLNKLQTTDYRLQTGTSLRDALGLTDVIFHIDNHAITHRPDLFSHIGFARECVAIGIAKWKKRPKDKPIAFPKAPLPFVIHNDCRTFVPRYSACLLSIDATGTTPAWMRQRLEATGFRSVNLPVDITNYVTMELGMPLHGFDVHDLRGDIHIRKTSKDEKVITLDGQERSLPTGAVVLSDEKGVFDLLGIMGGKRSSMKDTTRTLLLHAAAVSPSVIRQSILATGLRTDAATIYEKGIPPIFVPKGFSRALGLFLALVPGARITSKLLSFGNDGTAKRISLSLEHTSHIIGIDIPKKKVVSILENLGCIVQNPKSEIPACPAGRRNPKQKIKNKKQTTKSEQRAMSNEQLIVSPPLDREDLQEEHDLIEELARLHGYDRLPAMMPSSPCHPPKHDPRLHQMRTQAKEEGFLEILPLSLVGPNLLRRSNLSET
ncbi:phenylalanine--tRNA ligase subunit beta, partial [Candidatus Peregrinibacteria bacterium]|nr:phenylalanine--tRNA ligase subunit beta [Candidatus Peregrinibacteria bacterium]